jgi:HK97 family phage major capsid protein
MGPALWLPADRHAPATRDATPAATPRIIKHSLSESERLAKISRVNEIADRVENGAHLTTAIREEFDKLEVELRADCADREVNGEGQPAWAAPRDPLHVISQESAAKANAKRGLIGTDTHDLPDWHDGHALEARHDLTAYLSQSPDWNPSGLDMGSFDRDAFWVQLITGKTEGREFRALAEGAQSATFTSAGVTVPIAFAANVLALLRANLVFTSPSLDGSINGPQVVDMETQIQYIPVWATDAVAVASYVGEAPALVPGTAVLGSTLLTARTISSIQLANRQLVDDNATTGGIAGLIESNTAMALARAMDTSAIYGTGAPQPSGLFTAAYSGTLQTVSMGTNGAAPTNYDQISQAIEKVRVANDNPTGLYCNPQVHGTYSRLKNTLNDAMRPGSDVSSYWPPAYSTAFSATETQGTSSLCSSVLVMNANRVIMGMRQGLVLSTLVERYADTLQYGFQAYLRHDWAFPYSAAACRVLGILTT